MVFVPGEIPRLGVFSHGGRGTGSGKVELVFPGGTYGIRKRLMSADLIPLAEALPLLLAVEDREGTRLSSQAWAAAAAAGVGLVARGRLLPTVGAQGRDVWRAGPLDPADLNWMRELAAAFPPAAHALAVPGSRPMRLRSPEALIRDLWDAIADLIVRSPAAPRTTSSPAFAAADPSPVGDLAEWSPTPPTACRPGRVSGCGSRQSRSRPRTSSADVEDGEDGLGEAELAGGEEAGGRTRFPAGAAASQQRRSEPDRRRRRAVERAGDGAVQAARRQRPICCSHCGAARPYGRRSPRCCGRPARR